MIGIGIDTGGTYTDAVVYDMSAGRVLCSGKSPTTHTRLETGITKALDLLDPSYLKQAEMIALSTTLATNACLEDKGSRAKLLMIGMSPESMPNLPEIYGSYGFKELDQLIFIDGKPENMYEHPEEPDWDALMKNVPDWFAGLKAVGVCQIFPQYDGGKLERKAKETIRGAMDLSVTTAYDMFDEIDPLKRGAGTLLNARLVPTIDEFLKAVKNVLQERGLSIPVAIVRSDGSLMSEAMSREYPVETLLSGPAASVVGGCAIAGVRDAMIVDMGGTTTDVALVRDGRPLTAAKGISIGKWRTTVQGLYVDTFLLGGDSAVRYNTRGIYLDKGRVIPLSMLSKLHPQVTDKLRSLKERWKKHTRMLHEFYVLQKDISGDPAYTAEEQQLCACLKDGPLLPEELGEQIGKDLYYIRSARLEEEGIILRSGLTPTDMMVIRGEYDRYSPDAALEALDYLASNTDTDPRDIPGMVYRMVEKRMYCNLARILLSQQYGTRSLNPADENVMALIANTYDAAVSGKKAEWLSFPLKCELPIVGVGAPVHIFLPRVAELLGTHAIIRENAGVANAVGAIASQIVTKVTVKVKSVYDAGLLKGYIVYDDINRHQFEEYEEACAFARAVAKREVLRKSKKQGASSSPKVTITDHEVRYDLYLFENNIEAVATDSFL